MAERLRVTFGASTAADLLASVAAVADPEWRDTFAGTPDDARAAGRALLKRVTAFGRYPFVNLVAVVPETRAPHSAAALIDWVRRTPPATLHAVLAGGRRRALRAGLDDATLAAALAGDPAARRATRDALGRTVLTASRWLLTTRSAGVKDELLGVLTAWRDLRYPPAAERSLRATLMAEVAAQQKAARGRSGVDVIAAVAGGLTYDPPSSPRTVLLLPAPSVRPIVLVVDDVRTNVIAYPPAEPIAPRDRLLGLTRALGDKTRLRILELLRDGDRTAADLAAAIGTPRTTLLHHLAMLRAAGLLTTTVGPNNATYYALRPDAVPELHEAAVTVLQ